MNIINKISLLVLFFAILFTACQKENIDEIIPEKPDIKIDTIEVNPLIMQLRSNSADTIHIDCIKIPFPVDFLQVSGSTITINSQAELDSAGMLTDSIVDFIYPFEAVDDNGVIQIENIEDLVIAIQLCQVNSPE